MQPTEAWRVLAANLAAGATAGVVVEAALYPLDTIKTKVQAVASQGVKGILKGGGVRAMYAGIGGNLVGVAPATAMFMAVYEPVKAAALERTDASTAWIAHVAAAASAGFASSILRVPTEVVKQRMQLGQFPGPTAAVRQILAKEGLRKGLYAGYGAFLLRDLNFDIIEFVSYEQFKIAYKSQVLRGERELNAGEGAMLGAGAGGLTGVVTTPLDVIKTRLMTQGTSGTYKGAVDCAAKIIKTEGAGALMRGWAPRLMWISIGGSIFFGVLEQAKQAFAPKPPKPKKQK